VSGAPLSLVLVEHLVLVALPGVAAALCLARRGVSSVPVLLAGALAASGALGLLTFWAFYADPVAGESFSYLALFGAVALGVWALHGGHIERRLLRRLLTPLALWALGSAFLVFFGFVHGGSGEAITMPGTRFHPGLPTDSVIPSFYTEWFVAHGHRGNPPVFGDWLSSDRPPLQVGYALSQRRFGWDSTGLHYQVLGVLLQQLWIVGLWALLVASRVGRVTRALAMLTLLVSDVAIVNGFFVWPKMLPTAMLLAAAALVLTPLWDELRRSLWAAALIAALLGLAMLGHGSSAFGIIPLVAIAAFRGLPSWRWIGVALVVGAVVVAPWSAYQSYGDPPGNRLTKWTLAGVETIDERGTLETIVDSYGEAGVGGTLENKGQNFAMMSGGEPALNSLENAVDAVGAGDLETAVRDLRSIFFFNLLPSLGLLLIAPLAMALARRRGRRNPLEWSMALSCFAVFALGAVAWGLLAFGNPAARTSLHVGSYLLPVLGLCGAAVGLRATFPRFAIYYLSFNAALMLAIYAPSLDPPAGSSYSLLTALAAVVCLAGFVAVAFGLGRQRAGARSDQTSAANPAQEPTMPSRATASTSP
jgi:hypothetical protein